MAILSKIREKTYILIGIIGLALFAFIVQGAFGNGNSVKADVVGEINGEDISREEFSARLETYKSRNSSTTDMQASNVVWEGFVRERIYKEQLTNAGIVVGEEDVWDNIIMMPYFQNDPSFKNEVGLFDEEKVKEFIANMREDAIGADQNSIEKLTWLNWLNTENAIRQSVITTAYTSLVKSGLGTSLEEGKRDYLFSNTNITSEYVFVPYTAVADSLIKITNQDYQNYINEHKKEFLVDASRSIKYVKFNIVASDDDKKEIKKELSELIAGFKTAEDNKEFFDIEKSDLTINNNFLFKNRLPIAISDSIVDGNIGDVFGPYEENGYFKISKIDAFKKMPDSVSASHILISYIGSRSADATTTQTEEQAKVTADSILKVVKRNKSKFAALAEDFSIDKSTAVNGGDLDWFVYTKMVAEFRDYCFSNKKGDMGIVKTDFGFHIIKINDQKNIQNTVKLVTISRQIVASELTADNFYQDAEIFASDLMGGQDFDELSREKNYIPLPANNLKILDEKVPGIIGNNNRQIVRWAFEENTSKNDVERFDVDNGYVVVMLSSKTEKGLASVNDVASRIKPILIRKKKAGIINNKMSTATLQDIAKENEVNVKKAINVTLASPTISGVGNEPAVVGAMSTAKVGEVVNHIEGQKGVFAIQVTSRELPTELENYDSYRNRIETALKARSTQLYEALKENADIEDYRGYIY